MIPFYSPPTNWHPYNESERHLNRTNWFESGPILIQYDWLYTNSITRLKKTWKILEKAQSPNGPCLWDREPSSSLSRKGFSFTISLFFIYCLNYDIEWLERRSRRLRWCGKIAVDKANWMLLEYNCCRNEYCSGIVWMRNHLAGTREEVAACTKVSRDVRNKCIQILQILCDMFL